MLKEKIRPTDLDVSTEVWFMGSTFSLQGIRNEIQKNLLTISDEQLYLKYFHFLIKKEWNLKDLSKECKIKWDGFRILSYSQNSKVELRSRNNSNFNKRFLP